MEQPEIAAPVEGTGPDEIKKSSPDPEKVKEEAAEKGAKEEKEQDNSKATEEESEKKESAEGDAKAKDGSKKDGEDVVFIQDTGFTVKIVAPNLDPFDIQVSLLGQSFLHLIRTLLICGYIFELVGRLCFVPLLREDL